MLGYRTFFTVDGDNSDVIERVREQWYSWLRRKQYDADALQAGSIVPLADGVEATLLDQPMQDGSRSVRARLMENQEQNGRWTTQLTVHVPGRRGRSPWIWIDVDAPEEQRGGFGRSSRRWTGTPRLVRDLLEVFRATDGGAELRPTPERVTEAQVETLLDIVCDPDRRGPVFLAGSDAQIPLAQWAELVDGMLAETVGLAGSYVLTSEATVAFNALIGDTHAVAPATVRTYLPFADPADPLDALKHRVLSTGRILRDDGKNIRRMLGHKVRELTIEAPLSKLAARIDAQFERAIDELLVKALIPVPSQSAGTQTLDADADRQAAPNSQGALEGAPVEVETTGAPTAFPSSPGAAVTSQAEGYLALQELLIEVTGFDEVAPMTVAELSRLARAGIKAESGIKALQRRFDELEDRNDELKEQQELLVKRLEDEQLDHYETDTERARFQEQLRRLRARLARNGRVEESWAEEVTEFHDDRPTSFDDLLDRFTKLTFVMFTGDRDAALDLDEHEPLGNWARKAWEALLALEDYATASADGRCVTGVDGYLQNLPDGCSGFSGNRHARDESDAVKNNPTFAKRRMLPVPRDVSEDCAVFMGSHFKIAQAGMTSPRLHYYDDTAHSGKVYVGYIGRHLPTPQTN